MVGLKTEEVSVTLSVSILGTHLVNYPSMQGLLKKLETGRYKKKWNPKFSEIRYSSTNDSPDIRIEWPYFSMTVHFRRSILIGRYTSTARKILEDINSASGTEMST